MNEGQQHSTMAVATWVAWGVVGVLIVGLWVSLWQGSEPVAQACGFTACASSAIAATLHIRRFTCRTQTLMRTLLMRDAARSLDSEGLHPVR